MRQPETIEADWLADPDLARVIDAIEVDGDVARIVGGPVRDALLGLPVTDIDIATTALPQAVTERGEKAGLRVVPTGIDHGTVTLVSGHRAFEVTTLREDIETFGRRAKVRFGTSWLADAERRDFTMNALYASLDGRVHDPLGGIDDCLARRVRFIGNPDDRIAEDWLRILRFFRFHAVYGAGSMDMRGLESAIRLRDGLRSLARERIGQEVRRLLVANGAVPTLEIMSQAGILQIVLGGVDTLAVMARLVEVERALDLPSSFARRLAVLAVLVEDDVDRLRDRLRLSNGERDRILAMVRLAPRLRAGLDDRSARTNLYHAGREAFVDAVLVAWSRAASDPRNAAWTRLAQLPDRWALPVFPIQGKDLLAIGFAPGPDIGENLALLERRWREEGFTAGPEEILSWARSRSGEH